MEFVVQNKRHIKHVVTINNDSTMSITRYQVLGGVPLTIVKGMDDATTMRAALRSINNLVELTDEIYVLVVESQA